MDEPVYEPVPEASAPQTICPHCSTPFEAIYDSEGQIRCPFCGAEVILHEEYEDGEEAAEPDGASEDDLSALRIRVLSAGRRAGYRTRSYCIVAVGVCIVASVKLLLMTIAYVHTHGWGFTPFGYVLAALAALAGAMFFSRRTMELTRELSRPALEEPTTPPDFSTLSDGSQHWKNLENM